MRNRAWRRKKDFSKAERKRNIDLAVSHYNWKEYNNPLCPYNSFINYGIYDNIHQYSKNKIHCSCPYCSPRTRNKGKHRNGKNYSPSINYKPSEKRKIDSMNYEIENYEDDFI